MKRYSPQNIESKWRRIWEQKNTFRADIKKANKPYYNLMMFPYPSAEGLHVGNVYAFTGSDIYGRFERMRGNDVFEPIGFDAFGIHSENFAIKKGVHPKTLVARSVNHFRKQLKSLGCLFDWAHEVNTTDPRYYKWTQWLFLQLFKAGLAYRAKAPVDWCTSCKTVLADEQVIQGRCERCDSEVIQKELEQWFFRITKYADRLLKNLEHIDWSERTKIAQKNWIGKSEGAEIEFRIKNLELRIKVFTTRPDTLFGATYMVLAPEHSLISDFRPSTRAKLGVGLVPHRNKVSGAGFQISNWEQVEDYIKKVRTKSELERTELAKEKTGVELKGIKAINPANGEEIPVFVADYVLVGYGTGAIMAVPAHDKRDFEFAKKYGLPIREVIKSDRASQYLEEVGRKDSVSLTEAYEGAGFLVHSKNFSGMESEKAKWAITEFVKGESVVKYHLRDWLISRQRYWGPPIPIIYCYRCWEIRNSKSETQHQSGARCWTSPAPKRSFWCGVRNKFQIQNSKFKKKQQREGIDYVVIDGKEHAIVPVPEKDLPVLLPYVKEFRPTGTGKSPLASVEKFVKTKCPVCKGSAKRETDVSDTFLDSSWYFLRYPSVGFRNSKFVIRNSKQTQNAKSEITELPWDIAVIRKWLPVDMYIGGQEHAVLHLLYTRFITMALKDMGYLDFEEPFEKFRAHGLITKGGAKMSKSRGNVVNPDDYYAQYGADTLRMYLMFLGPYEQWGDWSDAGIVGIYRFLNRVWAFAQQWNLERKKSEIRNPKPSTRAELGAGPVPHRNEVSGAGSETNPKFQIPNSKHELEVLRHKTIKKVTEDIENLRYNTAIAALMEYLNKISDFRPSTRAKLGAGLVPHRNKVSGAGFQILEYEIKTLLLLLAPFAPHITEELWHEFGHKNSIHSEKWPPWEEKYLKEEKIVIVIQVNGRVRDQIEIEKGASEEEVREVAQKREKVVKWIESGAIKKVFFVQDRLINFVLE